MPGLSRRVWIGFRLAFDSEAVSVKQRYAWMLTRLAYVLPQALTE
jgi:hypothetical protein